jgi:hypothetical protein
MPNGESYASDERCSVNSHCWRRSSGDIWHDKENDFGRSASTGSTGVATVNDATALDGARNVPHGFRRPNWATDNV